MSDGRDEKDPGDDLPPTEAMPTPFRPYRPGDAPAVPPPLIQPPARAPFPWETQAPVVPPARPWETPVERSEAPVPPRPFVPELGDPQAPPASVPPKEPTGPNDLDAIFGASAFQEYEEESLFAAARRAPEELRPRERSARPVKEPKAPRESGDGIPRTQRTLMLVAVGVIGVLVLVLAFVIGTRNPGLLPAAAPAPVATTPADDAPAEEEAPVGPAEPGDHQWSDLAGTECVQPFASAWEQTYTVVDCSEPHDAQLVAKVVLDDDAASAWPGDEDLADRAGTVCAAQDVLDYTLARDITDLQVVGSYPATADAWAAGDRDYYCWVSRSAGEPLTTSLAAVPDAG